MATATDESPSPTMLMYRDELAELPPSAKFVAKVLEVEGALTQSTIISKTLLPRPTVGVALSRLEAADVIKTRPSMSDLRQTYYELKPRS